MEEILFPKPKLHLFVCINERANTLDSKPSCGPRILPEDVKELKLWLRQEGLTNQVYCTKAQCLGFCSPESSIAALYPQGKFIKYQKKEELKELIIKSLKELK